MPSFAIYISTPHFSKQIVAPHGWRNKSKQCKNSCVPVRSLSYKKPLYKTSYVQRYGVFFTLHNSHDLLLQPGATIRFEK